MPRIVVILKLWRWLLIVLAAGTMFLPLMSVLMSLEMSIPSPRNEGAVWLKGLILLTQGLVVWLAAQFFLIRGYFHKLDQAMQETGLLSTTWLEKLGLGVLLVVVFHCGLPMDALFNGLVRHLSLA